MTGLWRQPVSEMAAGIVSGRFSAADLVGSHFERATEVEAAVNCFVELLPGSLEQAAKIDRERATGENYARSPLRGIPFAFKDVFANGREAPGAGSRKVKIEIEATEAAALERLTAVGAVPIGRLSLDPFAFAVTGINDEYGDTRNPWSPERITGGSSSGAAVAVATGAVPFAIGSDTGGSVRIPSAFCGVLGLKPTLGRISKRGVLPLSYSQDTVGVIARSAADIALVLATLAGYDRADPVSVDVPVPDFEAELEASRDGDGALIGIRAGIDRKLIEARCEPVVVEAIEAGLEALTVAGAEIVPVDLSRLFAYDAAASVLTWAEALAVHGTSLAQNPERYPATIRARLEIAIAAQGTDHVDAMRLQGRALHELLSGPLQEISMIVAPTVPCVAPLREGLDDEDQVLNLAGRLLSLNRPFNFTGVPAISVPVGSDAEGLPLAIQLAARPWNESALLRAAAAIQDRFPFRFADLEGEGRKTRQEV